MLVINSLTGTPVEGTFTEPPGHMPIVGVNSGSAYRALRMSPAGIVILGGVAPVAIPFDVLVSLSPNAANTVEPAKPA